VEAKKFILDLIKEGKYFKEEGNVFHGAKLFLVYSVVRWVVQQAKEGEFDSTQVKNYLNVIGSYLDGEVNLFWENGALYVQKLK